MNDPFESRSDHERKRGSPVNKIEFGYILTQQIQRINSTLNPFQKYIAMRDLQSNLIADIKDFDFENKLKKITDDFETCTKSSEYRRLDQTAKDIKQYEYLSKQYDLLCQVAGKYYPGYNLEHSGEDYNEPDLTPLLARLRTLVNIEQKGAFIFCSGDTGTGKSTVGLKIGCDFDPEFRRVWDSRVCFDVVSLLDRLNTENLKYGSVFCFEEGGKNISNHAWHSELNKAVKDMAQLIRYKRLVIIMNARTMGLIDNQTRQFINFEIKAVSIDRANNLNKVRIYETNYNEEDKEIYKKKLVSPEGNPYLSYLYTPPDKEIMEGYTKLSEAWKTKELLESANNLREIALKPSPKTDAFNECWLVFADKKLEAPLIKIFAGQPKIDLNYIMGKYGLSDKLAREIGTRLKYKAMEEFNISL